jgi:septum formation protein
VQLILASGSPRRIELLSLLVASFRSMPSPVEETGSATPLPFSLPSLDLPAQFEPGSELDPRLWAWRKANDVLAINSGIIDDGDLVLGADTVVLAPGRALGKPTSHEDAVRMLELLKGREHYVVTGFALLRAGRSDPMLRVEAVATRVVMRDHSRSELERYVAHGEPMDKAGAYALQGLGGKLIERVDGCVRNVVGLPLCAVRDALIQAGAGVLPYPESGYCTFCPLKDAKG